MKVHGSNIKTIIPTGKVSNHLSMYHETEAEKDHCDNWDSQAASLDNGCVALLDGVVDSLGGVADLTDLLVVLVADLLLGGPVLGDVGVMTLLN